MSSMRLTVEAPGGPHLPLLRDLFDSESLAPPIIRSLPGGFTIKFEGASLKRAAFPQNLAALDLILGLGRDVAVSVAAAYLSGKFRKQNVAKVRALTRSLDTQGMEIFDVSIVATTPEELAKILRKVIDNDLESD